MSLKPAISTPTTSRGGTKPAAHSTAVSPQTSAAIALNMSWQLLAVVVVPVVGGHLLDVKFNTSPGIMVAGMVIALLGTIVVVRQTMSALGDNWNGESKGGSN